MTVLYILISVTLVEGHFLKSQEILAEPEVSTDEEQKSDEIKQPPPGNANNFKVLQFWAIYYLSIVEMELCHFQFGSHFVRIHFLKTIFCSIGALFFHLRADTILKGLCHPWNQTGTPKSCVPL